MTAHELARYLLDQPDLPVMVNGWGSDEGSENEVQGVTAHAGKLWVEYRERSQQSDDWMGKTAQ